ncbi:hypothetical protein E4U53_007051 [Claviceps sorghi]|nr:hypothetical protein E4U53_007051 [Claviceps sorghi]
MGPGEKSLDKLISDLHLDNPEKTFEECFDEVIQEAREIRKEMDPVLSEAEIKITKKLASPFEPGGLLVLGLQPKENHPWDEGFENVIEKCATLDSVNEALRLYGMDLRKDVSLLDTWACLPKKVTEKLQRVQPKRKDYFRALVLAAIDAKKPDCILCLGQDAMDTLPSDSKWRSGEWRVRVVDTYHPAHVFYYNEVDTTKALERLKQDISEACLITSKSEKVQELHLYRFTQLVAQCCFWPRAELLEYQLERRICNQHGELVLTTGIYVYGDIQQNWFRRAENIVNGTAEEEARKRLIPLFRILNRRWVRDSWFTNSYSLERKRIPLIMQGDLARIENDCYTISGSELDFKLKSEILAGRYTQDPSELNEEALWGWIGDVAIRGMKLWNQRKKKDLKSIPRYVGFG